MRKISDEESTRINIIVPNSMLKKIDAWRRQQADLPNVSEAMRRLIEMSLEQSAKPKGRR